MSNYKFTSPSEVREWLLNSQSPLVFDNCMNHWKAFDLWTPGYFAGLLAEKIHFRIGKKRLEASAAKQCKYDAVLWEKDCRYVAATISEFEEFTRDELSKGNPFGNVTSDEWVYADYKYMSEIFANHQEVLSDIDWGEFGFAGRSGMESTFWLGTAGAYTPCHYDTYGCNLVAQISGKKRWVLFPPTATNRLYPTRVPFEESSVFSQVNVAFPDYSRHPKFQSARRYTVTLEPGQVLYVPKHWWHYVECDSTAISVNTWIELESDSEERVSEALASLLTASLVEYSGASPQSVYNPKEEKLDFGEAQRTLNLSLSLTCSPAENQRVSGKFCDCCERSCSPLVADARNSNEPTASQSEASDSIPADVHLVNLINYVCHPKTLQCIRNLMIEDRLPA